MPAKQFCAVSRVRLDVPGTAAECEYNMSITERAAYLQGLAKGLEIDESTKEGKLLLALVDVVKEMSETIADLESNCEELDAVVDELDEDLGVLEDDFYHFDEDECSCDDDDDDCDCECEYQVTCPNCDVLVGLDEEMLSDGVVKCPNCGTELELDFDEDDCDCDDDCHCHEEK